MSYFIHQRRETSRRGFTLIELLIVIVIIGILASLLFVGGRAATTAVRRSLIKNEISQLGLALESYKHKYGEYPPDFSDSKAVMRHVRKRWPNYQTNEADFYAAMQNAGWDIDTANTLGAGYAGALAFWLGGPFDPSRGMLGGWGLDASNPFNLTQREEPMMEFTKGRNLMEYTVTSGSTSKKVYAIAARDMPMIYFRPSAIGYLTPAGKEGTHEQTYTLRHLHDQNLGCAVPYAKSLLDDPILGKFIGSDGKFNSTYVIKSNNVYKVTNSGAPLIVWHNPTGYQIVHPGLDENFGSEDDALPCEGLLRVIDPAQDVTVNCTLADNDNQANFGGTTIEAAGN